MYLYIQNINKQKCKQEEEAWGKVVTENSALSVQTEALEKSSD